MISACWYLHCHACSKVGQSLSYIIKLLILDEAVGCDTRTSIHTSEKGCEEVL